MDYLVRNVTAHAHRYPSCLSRLGDDLVIRCSWFTPPDTFSAVGPAPDIQILHGEKRETSSSVGISTATPTSITIIVPLNGRQNGTSWNAADIRGRFTCDH
jgi:hypothetical protein